MFERLKQSLWGALFGVLIAGQALGQTASLLPNGVQQYFNAQGQPVTSGTVDYFVPNTTTRKTTWSSSTESAGTQNPNPVLLNAGGYPQNGSGQINGTYGDGLYRQVVKDQNGIQIWDVVTSSTGSTSGSGTSFNGGVLVGTIIPWAGATLPNKYLYTAGQAVSRVTYPDLLTSLTYKTGVLCQAGGATLTVPVALTDIVPIGAPVEATCFAPGVTVQSKSSGSLTMSSGATATASTTITVFPWGNGDGSTTFNVPEQRGRTITGRDNMGGTIAGVVTGPIYGSNVGNQSPDALNATGGTQTKLISFTNLPNYTPSGTIDILALSGGSLIQAAPGGSAPFSPGAGTAYSLFSIGISPNPLTFHGTPTGGTQAPVGIIGPTRTADYIIKALPDDAPTGAGVTSIQGMTGALACGANLVCTAQTISVTLPTFPVRTGTALYATDFGVLCDGVTNDAPALQAAINQASAIGGVPVILPVGTCVTQSRIGLNRWSSVGGTLTVPGLDLRGQSRQGTILDTHVLNDWAVAVNPDWRAAHAALFGIASAAGGSLTPGGTYYVQITMNDGLGNEIFVTVPKSIVLGGGDSLITMTLPTVSNGYSYNIYLDTATQPAHYATVSGGNAVAIGGGQSITLTAIGSAQAVPSNKRAVWQTANISNLTVNGALHPATGGSGILLFKTGYSTIDNVYAFGYGGDGLDVPDYTGDVDGSFNDHVSNSKFGTNSGWGINAAGNVLELSNFTVDNLTAFDQNGTSNALVGPSHPFTITSITNANPGVFTTASNSLVTNDKIFVSGIAGMTLASGWYRASVLGPTTFNLKTLQGALIDTTALGAYTPSSGSEYLGWRPPTLTTGSGCLAWMGLIAKFDNIDFTQCHGTMIYASEGGGSDNLTISNMDCENTDGTCFYIGSIQGMTATNIELLSANALGATISGFQLGTGFAAGGVQNVSIKNVKYRSDVTTANAFEQYPNTNLTGTYIDTVKVDTPSITWQNWQGIARFTGFNFKGITGQVPLSIAGASQALLQPTGWGNTLPMKLCGTGCEWVEYHVPSGGVVTGGLSGTATTQYYFYLYNNAVVTAGNYGNPIVGAIEQSAGGPVLDSEGYLVKSGDSSRSYVGTALTNSGGTFSNATPLLSQYPLGAQSRQMIPLTMGTVPQAQATTNFTVGIGNATEANVQALCPINGGWFSNLTIKTSAPVAGQTLTATWRINGADTPITCVVTGPATTCNDRAVAHQSFCPQDQSYDLKLVTSATTGSLASIAGGIQFNTQQ